MGAAGLQRAQQMFTWRGVAESLASIYARVAGVEIDKQADVDAVDARLAAGSASG
jgi:hypothetical protein